MFCHFSKVNETTTLMDLLKASNEHKKRGLKEVPYRIIGTVITSVSEFGAISDRIRIPIKSYQEFSANSTTSPDGVLNCIELVDPDLKVKLLVYTAGESYPIYAAAFII